jgi:hypothetical protein
MVQMLEQNKLELGLRQPKTLPTFTKKKEVPRSEIQETLSTLLRDPKSRKHSTLLPIEERQSRVP